MSTGEQTPWAKRDAECTRASLLSRVRDGGDSAAWAEFEGRYRELVYRYCRRQGLQHVDAEDCTQAVLVNMVRYLPGFTYDRERGRFRDYLFRSTKNIIIRFRSRPAGASARVEMSMEQLLEDGSEAGGEGSASAQLVEAWEQEWVAHHMRRAFEVVRRQVEARSVELFEACLQGLSTAEVAQRFGVSVESVHKVKQRIRDRLQEQIRLQIEEEDGAHG